jgi:hypothetical protein
MARNLCPACRRTTVAVNYIKKGKTHYRSVCDRCARLGKKPKPLPPNWVLSGYKKKEQCERCGFRAKHGEQIEVFYINGNTDDPNWANLKSICRNCQVEIKNSRVRWKPSPLTPDF